VLGSQRSTTSYWAQHTRYIIMRNRLFRIFGAILGVAFLIFAVPIADTAPRTSWPPWVNVVTFIGMGAYLLHYAFTGRATLYRRRELKD
jgi:hypothetical protein